MKRLGYGKLSKQQGLDANKPIYGVSDKPRLKLVSSATETSKKNEMSRCMRFPTMWYVRRAKAQTSMRSLLIRTFASSLNIL